MSGIKIYLLVFGVLTIAGGVMGYVNKHSQASLIAGSISGVLLLVAAVLLGSNPQVGLWMALVVSAALAAKFGIGLVKGGGFMPAGLMTILSIPAIVLTVRALLHR